MWRVLALGLLLTLAAELTVFILLGRTIGFGATTALILLSMAGGGWLAKQQGLATLRRWPQTMAAGTPPGLAILDGLLVLLAGLLLLLPGLLTDIPGLLLLLPPVRRLVARVIIRILTARLLAQAARAAQAARGGAPGPGGATWSVGGSFGGPPPPRRPAGAGDVIDVKAERVETTALPPAPPTGG